MGLFQTVNKKNKFFFKNKFYFCFIVLLPKVAPYPFGSLIQFI